MRNLLLNDLTDLYLMNKREKEDVIDTVNLKKEKLSLLPNDHESMKLTVVMDMFVFKS